MKHNIYTATLISLGLATSFSAVSATQDIENIVVTANRVQQDQFLALSATQIIDKADIEAFQPLSVTDLLDQVAGISVTKQGDAGQTSSVFTRGTNNGHTLILIDGVRISSATLGSTSFGSLSVTQIERIEVVKGPRASLWGADAVGGVIQIFTKKLQSGEGVVSVGFGSNGLKKADASVGLGNNEHSLTLSVAGQESDGFSATDATGQEDDDGYDRYSFAVNGQSKVSDELLLNLTSRWEKGGNEYDSLFSKTSMPEAEFENFHVGVNAQLTQGDFYSEVSAATSANSSDTLKKGVKSSEFTTKRDQASVLASYQIADQTSVTGGVDWYVEKVSGTTSYDVAKRDVLAGYVQGRHQVGDVFFEAAVRRDDIENVKAQTTYNAAAGYQFSDTLIVSLSRATGFKAPSFNDLYYPSNFGYEGNVNVLPENSVSNELLIRKKYSQGQLEVSFYQSDVEDLIDWQKAEDGFTRPTNVAQAEIEGIDVNWSMNTGAFNHVVALSYVESKDAIKNTPLPRRPELTGNYTVSYQWEALTVGSIITYRDESKDKASSTSATLDDYWLVALTADYQVTDKLSLTGKINNLFDEKYSTANRYVSDGTNFVVNMTYEF